MKNVELLRCAKGLFPLFFLTFFLLGGCASAPSGDDAVTSALDATEGPKPSAALNTLLATLKKWGYDGVGLEYESDSTLDFLNRIFQNPRMGNRKIKLTYTGLALSYDPKHESLTIGGTSDVETVLKYAEKTIPSRPTKAP